MAGATGSAAASELWRSCNNQILIGGRDLAKAQALAAKFPDRATTARVDIFDPRSLDDFCGCCSVVVNCAGPVLATQDRVAQAALRARSNYVDVADLSFVRDRLLPSNSKLVDQGLSFVISAGWLPGITEMLPAYAYALAKTTMDTIHSLTVHFSDSGNWSVNAYRGMVWFLSNSQLRTPSYFSKGQRVRARMSESSPKAGLDPPIGVRRFSLLTIPELEDPANHFTDCDFRAYSY